MHSFSISGADNKDTSNLLLFKNTGKVISEVDLLVIIGMLASSVRFEFIQIVSKCNIDCKVHQ